MRISPWRRLRSWFDAVINFFVPKEGSLYIRPQSTPHDIDSDHAAAIVEQKQREAYRRIKAAGKSCLDGHKAPDEHVKDRVNVYFRKRGVEIPSEKRRPLRPVEVKLGSSDRNKRAVR